MRSVEGESVEVRTGSVKCVKCHWELWSVKCGVLSAKPQSLECRVWSVKCEVWVVKCPAWSGEWEMQSVDVGSGKWEV